MRRNTDWFHDARWGTFSHYLAAPASSRDGADLTSESWNRRVDGFDVKAHAEQLASVGVRYTFLTLGQNSGHYCSPNPVYDSFVGRRPSLCSQRDLVADLADALAREGIALLAYAPSHAPAVDIAAIEGLGCTPTWEDGARGWSFQGGFRVAEGADGRLTRFQRNWEAVLSEWSRRWGPKVRGWWMDGCYYSDRMYDFPDPPNFSSFAAALRAGNPDAIVAFNPGVKVPVISLTEHEDYTAGEISGAFPTPIIRPPKFRPVERWVNGAQYHVLTFMAGWWGQGEPRFGEEFVIGATKEINRCEGVITWDIPLDSRGVIPRPFLDRLAALRKAVG